jgi:hypothetical protein
MHLDVFLLALLIGLLLCGLLGSILAGENGDGKGFLLGFLLGPLGIFIVIFLGSPKREPFPTERPSRNS